MKSADYDVHIDACGSRTDYCEKCNIRVMLKDMEEHKLIKCGDLKAEDFPTEPTPENLPSAYMDGYTGDNPGGNFQGPLIGGGDLFFAPVQGEFGGHPNFGVPPEYLQGGALFYGGGGSGEEGPRERTEGRDVQVSVLLSSPCTSTYTYTCTCTCMYIHVHVCTSKPVHQVHYGM